MGRTPTRSSTTSGRCSIEWVSRDPLLFSFFEATFNPTDSSLSLRSLLPRHQPLQKDSSESREDGRRLERRCSFLSPPLPSRRAFRSFLSAADSIRSLSSFAAQVSSSRDSLQPPSHLRYLWIASRSEGRWEEVAVDLRFLRSFFSLTIYDFPLRFRREEG